VRHGKTELFFLCCGVDVGWWSLWTIRNVSWFLKRKWWETQLTVMIVLLTSVMIWPSLHHMLWTELNSEYNSFLQQLIMSWKCWQFHGVWLQRHQLMYVVSPACRLLLSWAHKFGTRPQRYCLYDYTETTQNLHVHDMKFVLFCSYIFIASHLSSKPLLLLHLFNCFQIKLYVLYCYQCHSYGLEKINKILDCNNDWLFTSRHTFMWHSKTFSFII
jgi:hypothetical protein